MFLTERQLRLLFRSILYESNKTSLDNFNVNIKGDECIVTGAGVADILNRLVGVGKGYGQLFEDISRKILEQEYSNILGKSYDLNPQSSSEYTDQTSSEKDAVLADIVMGKKIPKDGKFKIPELLDVALISVKSNKGAKKFKGEVDISKAVKLFNDIVDKESLTGNLQIDAIKLRVGTCNISLNPMASVAGPKKEIVYDMMYAIPTLPNICLANVNDAFTQKMLNIPSEFFNNDSKLVKENLIKPLLQNKASLRLQQLLHLHQIKKDKELNISHIVGTMTPYSFTRQGIKVHDAKYAATYNSFFAKRLYLFFNGIKSGEYLIQSVSQEKGATQKTFTPTVQGVPDIISNIKITDDLVDDLYKDFLSESADYEDIISIIADKLAVFLKDYLEKIKELKDKVTSFKKSYVRQLGIEKKRQSSEKTKVSYTSGVVNINFNAINNSLQSYHNIIPSSEEFKKFKIKDIETDRKGNNITRPTIAAVSKLVSVINAMAGGDIVSGDLDQFTINSSTIKSLLRESPMFSKGYYLNNNPEYIDKTFGDAYKDYKSVTIHNDKAYSSMIDKVKKVIGPDKVLDGLKPFNEIGYSQMLDEKTGLVKKDYIGFLDRNGLPISKPEKNEKGEMKYGDYGSFLNNIVKQSEFISGYKKIILSLSSLNENDFKEETVESMSSFFPDINDSRSLYDVYRKSHNLFTLKIIKKLVGLTADTRMEFIESEEEKTPELFDLDEIDDLKETVNDLIAVLEKDIKAASTEIDLDDLLKYIDLINELNIKFNKNPSDPSVFIMGNQITNLGLKIFIGLEEEEVAELLNYAQSLKNKKLQKEVLDVGKIDSASVETSNIETLLAVFNIVLNLYEAVAGLSYSEKLEKYSEFNQILSKNKFKEEESEEIEVEDQETTLSLEAKSYESILRKLLYKSTK